MSEIYDNSEMGETYRASIQDTAFPIHEENLPSDDEVNDLESAYNHLTLFEKLKDNRWQLRRRAYTELYDFFETGRVPANQGGEDLKPEAMIPWIQNMINEPNMIAMVDALKALNAFLTHHTCSRPQLASFTGRLIDKLVLTKKNIQNNILEILDKLLEGDEANNIIHEVLKRLDNKNHKFLNLLLGILLKYVKAKDGPDDANIKTIFRAIVPLMLHPNKETRHLALEILRVLYSYIEENFKELKSFAFENLRSIQLKELEVLQNATKVKGRKLVKLNDGYYKTSETGIKKAQGPVAQKVDLLSLLPEKYLELPYSVQVNQNEKNRKLEEFNHRLEQALKSGCEIDTHKDYSNILNLLKTMLEDKNILINTEAVKSVDYMIRMLKNNFPQSNLKCILTLIIEKLDAKKKTAYNTSLLQVLDDSIAYNCMVPETLCDLILYNAENNKNMNVRTACFNWFGTSFLTFLTAKRDVLYANMTRVVENQRPDKPSVSVTAKGGKLTGLNANIEPDERIEKLLATVYKRIQQQQKKEGNVPLKKRCQQILESLENLYAKAEVISPPKEEPDNYNAINDISSIKGNSKVINISNLTLQQGEYEENKGDEEEGEMMTQERMNRFEGSNSGRGEFAFENLKQVEKEQFGKLMNMFGEVKVQDEHVVDKMDAIGGFVDKMNMEVIQASQKKIVQGVKKVLRGHLSDYRNVVRLFESANNLLIKVNRICLEILPETLKVELKVMLLFLANILNGKSLEKTLDSMYMTCSLDKFLFCSLELFEKVDTKYVRMLPEEKLANAMRIYMNWLVIKVEKIQNVMFEGDQLRNLERDFSQFRFSNLPQVHLGVSNVLSKKLKTLEEHSAGNNSVRSYQTPRVEKHRTMSVDTSIIKEESRMDDLTEIEQNQINQKLNNIQEQVKSDVKGGLEKFSTLLSSIKKKNLDRLNMSHCMSPTLAGNSVSPNRHWKRGLGRESTPMRKMSMGTDLSDSLRKSRALHNLPGKENADQNKSINNIDVEAAAKFLANACSGLTEKEMASFELSLFKLKSLYSPKDYLHVLNTITPRLLAKELFNTKIPETRIIKMLKNHLESLDKPAYLRTLKALFCMKYRENDNEAAHNVAKIAVELTSNFYNQGRFPPKVIPIIVEMVVFSLTDHNLRAHGEEVLEAITKSVGRDGLRRYFEVELINSTRLYQVFLNYMDQQQSFGASPAQPKRELSPIQQKDQIMEEGNETHTLHDDSFNNSVTPQKMIPPPKRRSPTLDLRHSFDKALEDAEPQDIQFSRILENEDFDGPNFGIRKAPDSEISKGLQSLRNMFPTTAKREKSDEQAENPDVLDFQAVPSFAQFKQNLGNAFGVSDFNPSSEQKEPVRRSELQQRRMNRQVLGERNLEDLQGFGNREGMNMGKTVQDDKENVSGNQPEAMWYERGMKKEVRDSTPDKMKARYGQGKEEVANFMPSREMVIGYQTGSVQENKENVGVNSQEGMWYQGGKGMKEIKDGSAEKWKTKYIQEKERLQQTLEMLEKANNGYLSHVTEKSNLLEKLNNQRQMNESLYERFNVVANENEKLKKEAQNFEAEKLKMSQSIMSATMLQNKQEYKKFLNHKFITEALPIAAKGQGKNKEEFIKEFQELLLTADNLEFEVGESLMKIYEELEEYGEKVQFVVNLKNSVTHPQVLANLSVQNHKFLLEIALKLCVSENTQKEIVLGDDGVTFIETDLTNEMQLLLDGLLRFHSMNATISNLLRVLSDQMPTDFDVDMGKGTKMLLKLTVKCLVKLSSNFKSLVTEDIRVFDVLVEIYKLFKLHPPETLKEGQPNLKDFEIIFRNIRTLADHVIDLNPNKAKEFASFFSRESNKSIFLDYVKSYTTKYYPNLSGSMNLSNVSF